MSQKHLKKSVSRIRHNKCNCVHHTNELNKTVHRHVDSYYQRIHKKESSLSGSSEDYSSSSSSEELIEMKKTSHCKCFFQKKCVCKRKIKTVRNCPKSIITCKCKNKLICNCHKETSSFCDCDVECPSDSESSSCDTCNCDLCKRAKSHLQ